MEKDPDNGFAKPPAYDEADDLTTAFDKLHLPWLKELTLDKTKPTIDECIAHLKLLEAFSQLRDSIGLANGLYGIKDEFVPVNANDQEQQEILAKIREKRWAVYVTIATLRFQDYFQKAIQPQSYMLVQQDFEHAGYEDITDSGLRLKITSDNLPPLDVLMVLHSFILNPRNFLADCIRHGKMNLWTTGIPWQEVAAAIDNQSFAYEPGDNAKKLFESNTGRPWDNLHESPDYSLDCPRCSMLLNIPWTTAISRSSWTGENAGEKGNGFADKGLRIQCDCYLTIDHGLLRSQKFRKDVQDLVVRTIPMPGTLLNPDGRPKTYKYETSRLSQFRSTYKTAFPNRLLNMGGATEIIEQTEIRQATGTGPPDSFDAQRLGMISVDDIRASIERSMASSSLVKAATHGFTSKVGKLEKVSVRRMMSSYWENSSIFSMDLVGAVIRQGTFVQKMHQIDWLHSPAIRSTMERIIEKYERFFTIISVHPAQVAVPTLDVDLAWHTHQLSPPSYYTYSVFRTSKLIDHDDKINENKLSTSFEWTSKTYEKMFQTVYSECTCWYCEAIRESHTSKLSSLFSSSKTGVASDLEKLRKDPNPNLCDPNKTAHISAHNAIRTQNYPDTRIAERVKSRQLERGYQKAIDRAKKEGRPPPKKDDYMYYYAWGYPMYMPMYVPYMGDPCIHGDMYASNPSCGNFTQGAAGNCCAGTCGGSAGMGSCGAGGCSSSACAGGGGGAGCGGGGGGCGGGGGGGGGGCGGGGGG